jgi:hypothetical protein
MAKFLETQAISNELMKLIKDAKERIILVSYSFKVNPQIQERIKTKSKIGTLSEIVIIYGKTEIKQTDLEWMKEIQDLKIIEKSNLHAKCYLNEEKAIICSMNLYDYSQQNNIEMGIMITKSEDSEAYNELIEEINNIKINGIRKSIQEIANIEESPNTFNDQKILNEKSKGEIKKPSVTVQQKLFIELLKRFRYHKSKVERTSANQILSDEDIHNFCLQPNLNKNTIYESLPKKTAIKYGDQILSVLEDADRYAIGQVLSIWYQADETKYDRVKLKDLESGEEKWFDTTQELPQKDRIVAVKINRTWFNEYFYLDK